MIKLNSAKNTRSGSFFVLIMIQVQAYWKQTEMSHEFLLCLTFVLYKLCLDHVIKCC